MEFDTFSEEFPGKLGHVGGNSGNFGEDKGDSIEHLRNFREHSIGFRRSSPRGSLSAY